MNNLKGKILTILGIVGVIALVGGTFLYFENYEEVYYTKVDNSKMETGDISSDMKYIYTIDCYNKNGKKKEYTFKTYKELREGAYLELEIRAGGVHTWKEVEESELPEKVKEKYE